MTYPKVPPAAVGGRRPWHRLAAMTTAGLRRGQRTFAAVATVAMVASGAVPAVAQDVGADPATSDLRIGVLGVADAIAALGRTPELSEPLPYTRTSVADVLQLDAVVTDQLITAMTGSSLKEALAEVPGIVDVEDEGSGRLSFAYEQTIPAVALELAHDDGDLRFGADAAADALTVKLATPAGGERFEVQVDGSQLDPLLRFALVSEPELELSVAIDDASLAPFTARQGFTEIDVTGGHYRVERTSDIRLRDPNGRGLLTLEDLRYSNLVDLYRVEHTTDEVDIAFDVALPSGIGISGTTDDAASRSGTLTLTGPPTGDDVWPDTAGAVATYGDALDALTGLSLVDGVTALAEYTGAALVLQDAADVDFPNLGGSITDLFAPADDLLDLLATSAVAEIRCGLTPDNPPAGNAAPGDTVYCDAVPADGLGTVSSVTWSVADGGSVAVADTTKLAAVGPRPAETVRIDGSDGQPDVRLELELADGTTMTARSLPRTIQEVTSRITELGAQTDRAGSSSATVNLDAERLDVAVNLSASKASATLPVGDPATLGALVGLTGLSSGPEEDVGGGGGSGGGPATATATATGASFDVGFGIPTGAPAGPDDVQTIDLLPADGSLLEISGVSAATPTGLTDLTGRIGFLGVKVDVTTLTLGDGDGAPVVSLSVPAGTDSIAMDTLLTADGTLAAGAQVSLASQLTASIAFNATEKPISGTRYATTGGPASGGATIAWASGGLPGVTFTGDYADLRVFDPVPAAFLTGTATTTSSTQTVDDLTDPDTPATRDVSADTVTVTVSGVDLFTELGVPTGTDVEVARRLVAAGVSCQNVVLIDATTLTCEGLAPDGSAAYATGDTVDLIVLGDPFALRDGIIDGLAGSLNEFDRLTGDNLPDDGFADDQYTSTLPLVDLTPSQLAVEREDIAGGLAAVVAAATADEAGGNVTTPVSSAQELATAVPGLFGAGSTLAYTVGSSELDVAITASAPSGTTLTAPLRFAVDGTGQVVSDGDVTVGVTSSTTVATSVDVATARPGASAQAGATSTARLDATTELEGPIRAGVAELTVTAGSTASLGVTVATSRTTAADELTTARTSAGNEPAVGATADLVVDERDDDLVYTAAPTESSGGSGTAQPVPEPMQVRFLAEGLDGLATALDGGLDGASARVTGPDGAPVAAPLIGSDLDAGADVAGVLTGLTSALRDQLALPAVTDAATADELTTAVDAAVTAALEAAADVSGTAPTVTVTCDDCRPPCEEDATENCGVDGPTVWDAVSVTTTLTGDEKVGETGFDIGLAGINVRSDQPVGTTTSWTLPVTLELVRGVGPQVTIGADDTLDLDIAASLPAAGDVSTALGAATDPTCADRGAVQCIPAIIGYLPGMLTTTDASHGSLDTTVSVALAAGSYDLFELFDGVDATPTFADDTVAETGLALNFETVASDYGSFDLTGAINVPWTAAGGFADVTYTDVKLDVGEVIATLATPFDVVDPYLGPARDVIDVLRTPIPVVSDVSKLAGGDSISLLSLVESLQGENPRLDLAIRISGFLETAVEVVGAVAAYGQQTVPLEELAASGALLTVPPTQVAFASSCTQTVKTRTSATDATTGTTSTRQTAKTAPCPAPGTQNGARNQTTAEQRRGNRNTKTTVGTTTRSITGSAPGFSIPFLADPDQLVDVLTGEGEATYFRLDFGTLQAQVAYTRKFGPIMAGPVPIVPFIGGSITIEGRMAAGFDSMPQTLAVRSVPDGDIAALIAELDGFDGGDILREGFYLDDLDADGVDVPEVKLITTLEAGAGVSIGIVTAGLKGGVTLTINLDMNDPNGDGRIRTIEIRDIFAGDPACIFDVSATLEAFLQIFVEIELLVTRRNFVFDLVRLGPYTLFEYGCPDVVPTLVVAEDEALALTSGSRSGQRGAPSLTNIAENYEVRQFDTGGGAAAGGTTTFEVDAINRVQRVTVVPAAASGYTVTIYESGVAISTTPRETFTVTDLSALRFLADGNDGNDDEFSFLLGETFDDTGTLLSTPFTTSVTLHGHAGEDTLVTGDGDDTVTGGAGHDNISTGLGDDVITAGAGNDIVEAGTGLDDVDGGPGDDRLQGGPGPDRMVGGDGDDSLVGGPGRDVRALLISGNDYPTPQAQVELGFDSGDVLIGGPGADAVDGGDGSDVVVGGNAADLTTASLTGLFELVEDGRAVDVIDEVSRTIDERDVDIRTAVVPGWAAIDTLCVSGPADTSGGGADIVTGGPEADVVIGGDAADDLDGGGGDDEICGRAGDDNISGDGGATQLDAGDDTIRGGHGHDLIESGDGDDVVYGDDVALYRADTRVVDGSLGGTGTGAGDDYLATGDGDDVLAGGDGSDLLRGGAGDDRVYGEGSDTVDVGGEAPSLADRLVDCRPSTRIVHGHVDLNGDLLAGTAMITAVGGDDVVADDGRLAGLEVVDGVVRALGTSTAFTGLVAGETVVLDGLVDLDRDGDTDAADTGTVALASMLGTTADNADGDCLLGEDGDDDLRGGAGSDHVGAGAGTDLIAGGDGNDLLIGDGGTDVIMGGPHHDLLVGGDDPDHLVGGEGDDRLRGNGGDDDLVGGTGESEAADGQDVLLAGRGQDVLAGENATVVSDTIVSQVGAAWWSDEGIVPAAATAPAESVLRHDDSAVTCGDGAATRWVTLLPGAPDEPRVPVASPGGPVLYDELYGGFGCDWVFGQEGDDLVRGGQDDDVVEAGPGADTAHGDAGDDVVIGGSSVDPDVDGAITVGRSGAGVADGDDTMYGDGGPDAIAGRDLLVGDNGTPVRIAGASALTSPLLASLTLVPADVFTVQLADVQQHDETADTTTSGTDTIHGDGGPDVEDGRRDRIFGQGGADILSGDAGDDHLEGGAGADTIDGGGDDDDIVGGSSAANGTIGAHSDGSAAADSGDLRLDGGDGVDVIAGDNARIVRQTTLDGTWVQDEPRGGAAVRIVQLFDVTTDDPENVVAGAGGADTIHGDDPAGGAADDGPDLLFGQDGDDTITAGGGDDLVEGNAGDDTIHGDGGDDDLLGGSSSAVGTPLGADGRRLTDDLAPTGDTPELVDATAAGPVDAHDTIDGGAGEDVILGDNGRITRPGGALTSATSTQPVRDVAMADTTAGATSGSDTLHGGDGDDVLYGQLDDTTSELGSGDVLQGGTGNDAIIGDLAVVVLTPAQLLGEEDTLGLRKEVIAEDVYVADTLVPVTHVPDGLATDGGSDVALGDDGDDVLRLGGGPDLANGGAGEDTIFGGDGDDALWGGPGHDRLFGGYGADDLDLKPRTGDPGIYHEVAGDEDTDNEVDTTNDADLIYGGWGPDELQADVGDAGTQSGSDYLIDWVGAHNVYYVCEGAYGAGRVVRQPSPAMVSLLNELVVATGSTRIDVEDSGGWHDLGLVGNSAHSDNSSPSPEAPGNFTCEGTG